MTRDDIITMASEAQGGAESHCEFFAMTLDALERFAAIAIAAEREACARLAERVGSCDANMNKAWRNGCNDVAAAIRARGYQE